MKPVQIASVLNSAIQKEITGEVDLIKEDLSNIVDVGKVITSSLDVAGANAVNSFVQTIIDRVGRVKYVDRTYRSQAPNIVKDSFEYGSILMKVRAEVPDFQENTTWKLGDLDGYGIADAGELDPFVISAPKAEQMVFNKRITFEAPITIGEVQLKQAFTSASEMGRFIAMIENRIQLKMTLATDALIMRTINNLIGLKIGSSSTNVINLLSLYNTAVGVGNTLTAEQALRNTEFLRFATKTIALYKDYLKGASVNYNEGDYLTFTPEDRLKFVVLSEFAKDMETYLYADTYHNEFVKMAGYSTVPYWQSQGDGVDDYAIRSALDITATDGVSTYDVVQSGIIGVMFDEEAAAVVNENYRTTAQYNARGEYTNYFYKWDAGYMNDTYENCIVFLVADANSPVSASYEAISSTELAGYKEINPKAAGWYVKSGNDYILTTDTKPQAGTTYYRAVAAVPTT